MTREEMNLIRGFVTNIQSLKDAHINDKLPINYGMLCTITTKGWELLKELKTLEQQSEDAISRKEVIDTIFHECSGENLDIDFAKVLLLRRKILSLPPIQPKTKMGKCKWIRYDYRTICPQNHDIDNPYWRIPENTECLKYCPYCGKEIEVTK